MLKKDASVPVRKTLAGWRDRLKGQDLMAQFVRGSGGSLFIRIVSAGAAFGTTIIFSRLLGLQEYGTYAYALSWLTSLVLFGRLGFNLSATRYIASYASQEKWGELVGFIRYCVRTVYQSSFALSILALAIVFFAGGIIKEYYGDDGVYNTLLIALLSLPFVAHLEVTEGILDGFKRVVLAHLSMRIIRPILIGASLLFLFYATSLGEDGTLNAETGMAVHLGATVIALMIAVHFRKTILAKHVTTRAEPVFKKKEWFITSRDMMLASAFYLVLVQADVMMLGLLVGEEAAGLYTIASRVATLLILALSSVNAILQPIASALYANKKLKELQRIVSIAATSVFLISFIGCIVLYYAADYLFLVFGEEFKDTTGLLRILIIGQLANSFAGPAMLLLNMTGHERDSARIMAFGAVLNLVLNIVLIKLFGTPGAAYATAITTVLWNVIGAYVAWVRLRIVSLAFWKLRLKPLE